MIVLSSVQSNFFTNKLITFKSSLDSDVSVLDSDLTGQSKSKRYFNVGTHALITLKNIEEMLPIVGDFTIAAYAAGTTYTNYNADFKLTNIVSNSNKYYISIADANTGNAVSETAWWKEITLLSLLLKDIIRGAIENVISEIVQPDFIEDNTFLYRLGDLTDDTITSTGKWVGYRIFPTSSDHLLFILNQIGLHFVEDETITFYLYNQNTEIETFDLSVTGGYFQWQDLEAQYEMSSRLGAWYLFYSQVGLTGAAIGDNSIFDNCFYKYAHITPFECAVDTDLNTIDEDDLVYTKNFGLNLNFTISYDLTDFLKQHEMMFAQCYQLQLVRNLLDVFKNNPEVRSNLNQRNVDLDNLAYELTSYDGDTVVRKLRDSYSKLNASFKKLSCKDPAFEENEENEFDEGTV